MDNFEFPEEHIQHLVIRYLEGTASDEEISCLQEWLSLSEENYTFFNQYRRYWLQAGCLRYDAEKGWGYVSQRLEKNNNRRSVGLWVKIAGYAAAVILLVSVGYWGMKNYHPKPEYLVAAQEHIEPGGKKAILVLGSDQKIELNNYSHDSLFQNNASVKKEGNTLVYGGGDTDKHEHNRLITPRGGEYSVVLSDGTRVWLNAESELKYPVKFSGSERKVYLKGEAYFSVTKREGQTFVVASDKAEITVLGTEFNVNNYNNNAVTTTLVKGSVRIMHEGGKACQLAPGQQAVVSDKGDIKVREVETILYTAWKDGYFVYRDKTLDDILKELSRWYDFTYFYQNGAMENVALTAKLQKFDSVEKIFEILSETGRFRFVTKGKTVTVVAK